MFSFYFFLEQNYTEKSSFSLPILFYNPIEILKEPKNYNTFKAWVEYMMYGVVDLFCGVGGLTCGLEKAGLDVVAGYDLDATCEYTYSHNNNAQFIHKNIEEVTGLDIKDGCEDMM